MRASSSSSFRPRSLRTRTAAPSSARQSRQALRSSWCASTGRSGPGCRFRRSATCRRLSAPSILATPRPCSLATPSPSSTARLTLARSSRSSVSGWGRRASNWRSSRRRRTRVPESPFARPAPPRSVTTPSSRTSAPRLRIWWRAATISSSIRATARSST